MSFDWLDAHSFYEDERRPVSPVEVESPKKIYHEIEDVIRQLNVSSSRCTKVEELFAQDILGRRLKIKSLCEKLITNHSVKVYGGYARDKLWKFVLYDAVQRARKLHKDKEWSILELSYIKAHLQTGVAQLHTFVMSIQGSQDFNEVPLLAHPCSLDGILNEDMLRIQKSRDATEDEKEGQKKLVELLAMCFINIGDLYRYMRDIFSKSSKIGEDDVDYFCKAQEWYTHAYLMNPSVGLALNQLGNIYSEKNFGLDSLYYLLYSSLTENAYEGALPNLRQLLDTKMVQFARRPALPEPKPVELLANGLNRLLYQLLFEEVQINYEKFCQDILSNFHERLVTYDPDMDEQMLYKFSIVSIMMVWRLQSINSIHTSPAVAFAMSVFFTLVTQLGVILEEHSIVRKSMEETCHNNLSQNDVNFSQNDDILSVKSNNKEELALGAATSQSPELERKSKNKRKKIGRGRGLRFRSSSIPSLHSLESDSEEDESDEVDDEGSEVWSDSEYTDSDAESDVEKESNVESSVADNLLKLKTKAFSSSSSNGRSETSGSGENSQKSFEGLKHELLEAFHLNDLDTPTIGEADSTSSTSGEKDRLSLDTEGLQKSQERAQPILVALTPFLRWLQTCPAVKDALAANAEKVFLQKLCEILTLLTSHNWAQALDEIGEKFKARLSEDWDKLTSCTEEKVVYDDLFHYQLPEDRSMLGMLRLKNFVQGLEITDELTQNDKIVIRIGRFVSFGMWMNKTESFSMMYSDEDQKFFIPTPEMLKNHLRSSRIKQLLRGKNGPENLTRLTRAYQEMKLEDRDRRHRDRDNRRRRNRNRGGGGDSVRPRGGRNGFRRQGVPLKVDDKPICVVIDMDAALKYTDIVKKLSCDKNFIIYVPRCIFESLDMMKESDEIAKDCYFWMDTAVKRNHPGIHIMKNSDKKRLNTEYPAENSSIEIGEYFEMLECCHFLITTEFEGNPYSHIHTAFGDHRDKYSVFFLSGNDTLLDTSIKRGGFDPIKIARSLPGVFVDCIFEYPPSRKPVSRKGRKWKTSGKCKG